jgi:hypothetical protein
MRLSHAELQEREDRIARLVAIQKRLEIAEEIALAYRHTALLELVTECYELLIRAKRDEIARLVGRKSGDVDKLSDMIDEISSMFEE